MIHLAVLTAPELLIFIFILRRVIIYISCVGSSFRLRTDFKNFVRRIWWDMVGLFNFSLLLNYPLGLVGLHFLLSPWSDRVRSISFLVSRATLQHCNIPACNTLTLQHLSNIPATSQHCNTTATPQPCNNPTMQHCNTATPQPCNTTATPQHFYATATPEQRAKQQLH